MRLNMTQTVPLLNSSALFELGNSSILINEKDRFISFDFPIVCPCCRKSNENLVKNGHDTSIHGSPQRYKCNCCGKQFMAHTSYFWQEQKVKFIERIIETYYTESRTYKSIAREFHLNESQVCRLLDSFWFAVQKKAVEMELLSESLWDIVKVEREKTTILYLDETFIKIKGDQWYLITAVDSLGQVIHHKLVHTRETAVLWPFWEDLMQKCPQACVFVTDSAPFYEKMCKLMKKPIYHIEHVHKGDRRKVIVTKHEYDSINRKFSMYQLGMKTDTLLKKNTQEICYFEKHRKEIQLGIGGGRPKGSKDKKKRKIYQRKRNNKSSKHNKPKKTKKKRGRKSVFKNGLRFQLDWQIEPFNFSLIPIDPAFSTNEWTKNPTTTILELLMIVNMEFEGKHITSNRIETVFHQLDAWETFTGNFNISSVDRDITLLFGYNNWIKYCFSICQSIKSKINVKPCVKMFGQQFKFQKIINN